jgi:predicted MPP superfamily phosphohydrolase
MRLSLIHLSDIHFKGPRDVILRRTEKLAAAIRSTLSYSEDEQVFLTVSGDIAFSGHPDEYTIASSFLSKLLDLLKLPMVPGPSRVVLIPGNHDCTLSEQGDLRTTLLETLRSRFDDLDLGGESAAAILRVQDNFFAFQASVRGDEVLQSGKRIRYSYQFHIDGFSIGFECFNSAWLSQRHEEPAKLFIPKSAFPAECNDSCSDLVISLVHHPSNWLDPINARSFSQALRRNSDFILSGHEHASSSYQRSRVGEEVIQVLEAGALQDEFSGESEFAILQVDTTTNRFRHDQFVFQAGHYANVSASAPWVQYERNPAIASRQLSLNTATMAYLRDAGTGFTHPRSALLHLDDIFIYPELITQTPASLQPVDPPLPKKIVSKTVVESILRAKRSLIVGLDNIGKTALAKSLCLDCYLHDNLFPLIINGSEFRGGDPKESYRTCLRNAIGRQYGEQFIDKYIQLETSKRVLVIDDWHKTHFNVDGRDILLGEITKHWECVVLLVSDIYTMQGAAESMGPSSLHKFIRLDISEFGHLLRSRLIERWHSLGREFTYDEDKMTELVAESEGIVNTMIGRNLLPSTPVTILTILQSYDATAVNRNSATGSYGQLYEALITTSLAQVVNKSVDVGTRYAYISHIAYFVFIREQTSMSHEDMEQVHQSYYDQFQMQLELSTMLEELQTAQILYRVEGRYRFKYKYLYCYFVAKYFQESMANAIDASELKTQLLSVADHVFYEDYANIIIFYIYLTKDRSLIEYILNNAAEIYAEVEPFDFEGHADFLNKSSGVRAEYLLPSTPVTVNRESYLEEKDREGVPMVKYHEDETGKLVTYRNCREPLQRLAIALRTLTIMGQILRNFPGVLHKDIKVNLATQSYELGLRTLRNVLLSMELNLGDLQRHYGELLRERMPIDKSREKVEQSADELIINTARLVGFAMVKRVSQAVGLRDLVATYRAVREDAKGRKSFDMIDLSIKLDHFAEFPENEATHMAAYMKSNLYGYTLVRDLVINRLYLFPSVYRVRQAMGKLLDFKVGEPSLISGGRRRLK